MKAIDRFYEYLAEKGLKPTTVEKEIGLSNGYLSAQKKRSADMGEGMMLKVIDYFRDINPMWLLTGEGPMLRTEQRIQASQLEIQSVSPTDESIIYKMYKEKDLEVKDLMETIGSLKEQIRQLKRENERLASGASDSIHVNVG